MRGDIQKPPPDRSPEEQSRDNYCLIFGHDFTVGVTVTNSYRLMCANHCWIDQNYVVVPREETL